MKSVLFKLFLVSLASLLLLACQSRQTSRHVPFKDIQDAAPKNTNIDWSKVKPAVPKYEPKSRYGNPVAYEQNGITYQVLNSAKGYKEVALASWYGTKFHGRRTSSGEVYDMYKMTAAHKTLPLPTYAKVTNLENGKEIIVKINDRGPFAPGRIIDLSYAAAHKLEMTKKGIAKVRVEAIIVPPSYSNVKSDGVQRFVQVGAYSVHKTAQKLAKVLDKEIRLPVTITTLTRDGKKLYRVRIGPVPTQAMAEELARVLNIKELGKPSIIYD
jgi:rare lipoprotein A